MSNMPAGSPRVRALEPEGVAPPLPPYSLVTIAGEQLVAVAGQMPVAPDGQWVTGEFRSQAEQVFENLERCLAAAGCGLRDVFKVNAYLADFTHLDEFNRMYRERFAEPYPVRTTVRCDLIGEHTLIEIDAQALCPGS